MYGPTCYAYNAALLCVDCAESEMTDLDTEGITDNGDTDTYPQPVFDHESDSPESCDACMTLIPASLTADGLKAASEMISPYLIADISYGAVSLHNPTDYIRDLADTYPDALDDATRRGTQAFHTARFTRDSDGRLPSYTGYGFYPLIYALVSMGEHVTVCPDCANKVDNGELYGLLLDCEVYEGSEEEYVWRNSDDDGPDAVFHGLSYCDGCSQSYFTIFHFESDVNNR